MEQRTIDDICGKMPDSWEKWESRQSEKPEKDLVQLLKNASLGRFPQE